MYFLDAKKVFNTYYTETGMDRREMFSDSGSEQMMFFDFKKGSKSLRQEISLLFDSEYRAPHKFSLSANQYTMDPLEIEVLLFKNGESEPYDVVILEGLRTILTLEPNTTKVVIGCNKDKCEGKSAKVKFSVNYIEY